MSRLRLIAAAALLPLATALAVPASASPTTTPTAPTASPVRSAQASRWIVRTGDPAAVSRLVAARGGRVVSAAAALGIVVVDADAATADAVRGLPAVTGVSADAPVRMTALGYDPATQNGSMTKVTAITGAQQAWRWGWTGAGVDVALLDTGVAPVAGLTGADKVVVGPDLSFESQSPSLRHLDTYGHGTHMAGIIAGREGARRSGWDYAADTKNFYGMAPDARVVSVKLADHDGAVDVSQVIAGINWIVQNKTSNGLNIRVLNLSFGTESPQSPQLDPLSWAAESAWNAGIVVVAAAGNDGGRVKGLSNPAYNPWVVAVGAVDTKGTASTFDDVVPAFSARGATLFGATRNPDLVAPGVGIVAPGVPGSLLYGSYASARVGNGLLRGSGTSQAAAVVSGAAALLLQHRPNLTPDQVKSVLTGSADWLPNAGVADAGKGGLDVDGAILTLPSLLGQRATRGTGTGSLEAARGGFHVEADGTQLVGETDILGGAWLASSFAQATWNRTSWGADGSFNGNLWTGDSFVADSGVGGAAWSGRTWSGRTWSGRTWSGRTWSGRTWSSAGWSGSGWVDGTWTSTVSPSKWTGSLWATGTWG